MTMIWSFSYNSFVKLHGKKYGSYNMTVLYLNRVLTKCVIKGLHCTLHFVCRAQIHSSTCKYRNIVFAVNLFDIIQVY